MYVIIVIASVAKQSLLLLNEIAITIPFIQNFILYKGLIERFQIVILILMNLNQNIIS